MSDAPVVGIDLGTTFSAIAAIDRHGQPRVLPNLEGRRTTPSVVYFEHGGGVVVGEMARNQALADPSRTVQYIKRAMGDPSFQLHVDGVDYVAEAISALILQKLRTDAAAHLGTEIRQAVISVPAYFKDSQRLATRKAGEIAGLEVVAIINEPTAAAIAYGFARGGDHGHVLVYDFGGGTFDVTVLRIDGNEFTVIGTDGDSRLGGIDVDERLADHLASRFLEHHGIDLRDEATTKLDLSQRAEVAKIDLSTRQSVKVTLSAGAQAMRVDVDRDLLNDLVCDLLARTEECMTRALDATGLDWASIDAVLLVGGSSRMSMVKDLVRRLSGKEPSTDVNPDECVALGAALRAGLEVAETPAVPRKGRSETNPSLGGPEVGIVISDVAPHSLGVRAISGDGRPVNSIIIPRLTPVPCERKRTYATRADNQRSIEIEVLQGEDPDPFSVEVEGVGRVKIDDLPERPAGGVIVAVSLRYDADGVVEVLAEELLEGRVVRERLLRKSGELDLRMVNKMQSQLDALTADSPPSADVEAPAAVDALEPEPVVVEDEDAEIVGDHTPTVHDLYAALGVPRTATTSEIQVALAGRQEELEARRQAASSLDPDAAERTAIEQELVTLGAAGTILSDADARADYDSLAEDPLDKISHGPDDSGGPR